jgi:hypothetical protein
LRVMGQVDQDGGHEREEEAGDHRGA